MPDPDTAARIAEMAGRLRSEMHVKARLLHPERLHITLHHLGDFAHLPEVTVARACAAATSIDVPPFGVAFDQISSFNGRPGHRPLVLTGRAGLDELIDFQRRLGDALRGAGLRVSRARFTPHLTLLYDEGRFDPRAIGPITWTVREFVLIHSWLGKTRYDVKGRWPLRGGGPSV
ncbi:RNA 2',3'-cyclic phosphodiesterase [Trinickia terrae]|uniref:RNA 2',3'-cyclic phosphodiesterase n=1 Tax=Trinickia terrae TaxID=2571161 RepID=A0A4U1HFW9_9BURK|nr:2'-5' RNA ligase family protein [Trinickia terrae]TKC78843.1 RNA 2',3'-cyclic phosphodiesterase [Trinickia terrae]